MLLALLLSLLIGLLLGLFGGGGSILTVPMLIYLLHLEPKQAIATSFVAVGVASLLALLPHARRGAVCWQSGFSFGTAGMVGAFAGARIAAHFPGDILLLLFGLVALTSGVLMLRRKATTGQVKVVSADYPMCPLRLPVLKLIFDGVAVGALTGMVGVGGGFLIVPALTLLVGLPMAAAVGTSLLVIAMNALAGLIGFGSEVAWQVDLTVVVAGGVLAGSALGSWGAAWLSPQWSRRAFGLIVLLVAAYVLSQVGGDALLSLLQTSVNNPRLLGKVVVGLLLIGMLIHIAYWIHRLDRLSPTSVGH